MGGGGVSLNPVKTVKNVLDPKKSFEFSKELYGSGKIFYDPAGVTDPDNEDTLAGGVFGEGGQYLADPMGLIEGTAVNKANNPESVDIGEIAGSTVDTAAAANAADLNRRRARATGRASTMLYSGGTANTGTTQLLGG